ncbi:MAG TPA: hypothetical protein VFM09_11640 [Marmoricola sp.]|nr:hypothetical protein [Marmoricola sp.]
MRTRTGSSTGTDHRRRSTRRRSWPAVLAAAALGVFVTLGAAPAGADGDPLGTLVNGLQDQVQSVQKSTQGATGTRSTSSTTSVPAQDAPNPPTSDSDSPGHETPNPTAPDHGSSYVNHTGLAGNDLVDVGSTDSQINNNDSTRSDTTVLAVGGQEIAGSHASSSGKHHDSFDPLAPICENSGGQVCLSVLYASSSASRSAATSKSSGRTGIANACVGGSDTTNTTCSGPVHIGAGTASSSATRDRASGETKARSSSSLASVCLGPTGCDLAVGAMQSSGRADSDPTASRHSSVLNVNAGGQQVADITDPTAIAVPPGCAVPVVCVFLNQGETYVSSDVAGHNQQALDLEALPGVAVLTLGQSETLVHNDGGQAVSAPGGNGGNGGPGGAVQAPHAGHAGAAATAAGPTAAASVLPNTGGFWSGLIGVALLLVGAGAMLLAWARRGAALV